MDGRRADPVLGFYGPDSMMWRINREAVLLGAGPTALLLQIAHPLVAEGVARHSTFEADPFKRLHGTITTTMDLVFGDGPAAERAVRKLNGVHATIKGPVADEHARRIAESFRALDPELLLWVQATLIVTSVRTYSRWVAPLSRPDLERFWQEARSVGTRLGIPLSLSPADWPALAAYWRRMLAPDGPIHVTPTAKRLAPLIVRPPIAVHADPCGRPARHTRSRASAQQAARRVRHRVGRWARGDRQSSFAGYSRLDDRRAGQSSADAPGEGRLRPDRGAWREY